MTWAVVADAVGVRSVGVEVGVALVMWQRGMLVTGIGPLGAGGGECPGQW